MPSNIQSIQPSLAKIYEPKKKMDASGEYYDFDNDGKLSKGELVSENQSAENFLEHVVYAENNIVKIKQVYDVLTIANERTQQSINKFESNLIARAALLASGVLPKELKVYLKKLDYLFAGYEKNIHPKDSALGKIDILHQYLTKKNPERYRSEQYRLDITIDRQIQSLSDSDDPKMEIGNCVSLTTLFNILAVRAGIDIKTIVRPLHVLSAFGDTTIENTSSYWPGRLLNTDQTRSAFDIVIEIYDWHASRYLFSGQFNKAIESQKAIAELYPEISGPYIYLGEAYLFTGQFEKSIEWFKKGIALEKDPKMKAAIYWDMGFAYIGLGEKKEAQKCFLLSFKGEKAQ
jgi:tetratricopeptide (TPR) repeat protein